MKKPSVRRVGLHAAAFLALSGSSSAHSWIEMAYRIAPNGTLVGNVGYPRGYVPRNSTDPIFQDSIPVCLLPEAGQGAYSGDEILNKFPKQENPKYPMLEAAAGDFIALLHLENGHTTLPQNQPKKPQNRGTIFFYGTSQPKEQERLFDVHLMWNRNGTGGDGRGRLLATRNYDDGQCYQPNNGVISTQRAAELSPDGAVHTQELACQSDIRLPSDLKPGSTYTIYWYWDWPDLDADHIDFEGTKNGLYPWAGTFMRGQKDPNGFSMAAIAKNESYASTIDIKITGRDSADFGSKHFVANEYVEEQNIYSKAIKGQLDSNYQVDLDGSDSSNGRNSQLKTTMASTAPFITPTTSLPEPQTAAGSATGGERSPTQSTHTPPTVTVTSLVTIQPLTVWKTVTKTGSPSPSPTTQEEQQQQQQQQASTVIAYITTHVPAGYYNTALRGRPTVMPFTLLASAAPTTVQASRRQDWNFGRR